MEVAIITLIICVIICSLADRIQMNRIEDKIDELKSETNGLKKYSNEDLHDNWTITEVN